MARPNKIGIDYFPMNVDFFDDDKLQLIEAEFGIKGSYVAIRLLCKIYKNGYFYQWGDDLCLLFAKQLGGGFVPNTVDEIVKGLVRRSFFDKGVFDSFQILTSRGIQQRYIEAKRGHVFIDPKINLIEVIAAETPVIAAETPVIATNCKEKESSKEKETKEKKSKVNLDSSPNVEESLSDWPSDDDSDSEENDVMIDYEKLISYWNLKTKKKWGELRTIQNERRRRVRARIRENGKETFIAAIEKACASQFLADASWFNFDWMICPNNFDKLITGNYDNKAQNNGNETTDTDRRKHVSKPTGGFSSDF